MLYDSQERGRDYASAAQRSQPLSLAGANDTADGFAKHSFPPQQAPDRHCAGDGLYSTLFSEKPQWP